MQPLDRPAQALEQPAALLAAGEVALHPPAPTRRELGVNVLGHALRRPPVVAPEALSIEEAAHLA